MGLPLLLTFATCTTVLGGCSSILAEGASAGAGVASASIAHGVTDNAAVVTGILGGTGLPCKEIVCSVDHAGKNEVTREFYTATICRDGDKWKWATAEP